MAKKLSSPPAEITADKAAPMLNITPRAVQNLCRAGKLAGARKLDPDKLTSPWVIPLESIEAEIKRRAQAVMA